MPAVPWAAGEEALQGLRDTGMLKWAYHRNPAHAAWSGPGNILFTMIVDGGFGRGAPASLALLCMGTAPTELGSLIAVRVMRFLRGQRPRGVT